VPSLPSCFPVRYRRAGLPKPATQPAPWPLAQAPVSSLKERGRVKGVEAGSDGSGDEVWTVNPAVLLV